MSWAEAVTFEPGEQVVREFPLGAKLSLDAGLVAVTNRRVLVVQHKGNILRNYHLIAETRLERIRGIAVDGIVNEKVTVTTPDSKGGMLWFYMGKDVDAFQKIVHYQRQLRLESLQSELAQQRMAMPAQPQAPMMVKEVIRETVLIQCRNCSARYPQGTLKCLTCGANL